MGTSLYNIISYLRIWNYDLFWKVCVPSFFLFLNCWEFETLIFEETWNLTCDNLKIWNFEVFRLGNFESLKLWKAFAPENDEESRTKIFEILDMNFISIKNHDMKFGNVFLLIDSLTLLIGDRWEVLGQLGGALGSIMVHFWKKLMSCCILRLTTCRSIRDRSKSHPGQFFEIFGDPDMSCGGEACRMTCSSPFANGLQLILSRLIKLIDSVIILSNKMPWNTLIQGWE